MGGRGAGQRPRLVGKEGPDGRRLLLGGSQKVLCGRRSETLFSNRGKELLSTTPSLRVFVSKTSV